MGRTWRGIDKKKKEEIKKFRKDRHKRSTELPKKEDRRQDKRNNNETQNPW
jgi:hypothetical protein